MGQIHVLKMNLKRLTRFCLVQKPLCRSCVHGASYTQSVPTSTMHELPVFQTWPPAKPSEGNLSRLQTGLLPSIALISQTYVVHRCSIKNQRKAHITSPGSQPKPITARLGYPSSCLHNKTVWSIHKNRVLRRSVLLRGRSLWYHLAQEHVISMSFRVITV